MRRSWARQRGITESETSGIKSKMSGVSEVERGVSQGIGHVCENQKHDKLRRHET